MARGTGNQGTTLLGIRAPLPSMSADETIDPLDAAQTLPRTALDERAAEAVLAAPVPEATQEVAVENILLETYVDPPPRPSVPIASASQALAASRRAAPTSSSRFAIPRPGSAPSSTASRVRSAPKMPAVSPSAVVLSAVAPSAVAPSAVAPESFSKTAAASPSAVFPEVSPALVPKGPPSDAALGSVRIAAAIAACVPAEGLATPAPSEHDLGRTPAPPEAYAELTSQPPPPALPPAPPSSTSLDFAPPPAPLVPSDMAAVAPPPSGPASFPPYPRPSPLPLFLVSSPPPKKKSTRLPLVPLFLIAGLVVAVVAFFAVRRAFTHRTAMALEASSRAHEAPEKPAVTSGGVAMEAPRIAETAAPSVEPSAVPIVSASELPSATGPSAPAAPSPAHGATSSTDVPDGMTLVSFPRAAKGHRMYFDGSLLQGETGEPRLLKCGTHTLKIGSAGKPQRVDLPCGRTFALP